MGPRPTRPPQPLRLAPRRRLLLFFPDPDRPGSPPLGPTKRLPPPPRRSLHRHDSGRRNITGRPHQLPPTLVASADRHPPSAIPSGNVGISPRTSPGLRHPPPNLALPLGKSLERPGLPYCPNGSLRIPQTPPTTRPLNNLSCRAENERSKKRRSFAVEASLPPHECRVPAEPSRLTLPPLPLQPLHQQP